MFLNIERSSVDLPLWSFRGKPGSLFGSESFILQWKCHVLVIDRESPPEMSIENCHSSKTFPPPPPTFPTHNKYHLPFHPGKYSTMYLSIHASNNFKPQRSLKGKLWKVQKWNKILLKRMCELTCSHYFHMDSKAGLHDNSVIYCSLVLDITACRQQQSKQSRKSKEKGTRANPWTQKVKLLTAVFPRISASFPASKAVVFPSVGSRTRPPFFEGFLLSSSRRVRKKPKKTHPTASAMRIKLNQCSETEHEPDWNQ